MNSAEFSILNGNLDIYLKPRILEWKQLFIFPLQWVIIYDTYFNSLLTILWQVASKDGHKWTKPHSIDVFLCSFPLESGLVLLLPNKMWWKWSSRIAELGHKKPYGFCLTWMFPLGSIPLGDLWQDQASWADHMEKNEVFQSTCQQTSQLTAGINC